MRLSAALLVLGTLCAQPPQTKVDPVTETLHGVKITDPYRWLEDQKSSETRAWIDAQMKYTEGYLAGIPQREGIKKRLAALLKYDSMGTPNEAGGRYFLTKRAADQPQSVLYMRTGKTGQDQVLLDPNPISPDHTTSIGTWQVSRDGKVLIYGLRQGGEDELALQAFDVDTRQPLADKFPRARYSGVSIKPDHSGVYYSKFSPEGPRVFYHSLGASPDSDKLVFGEKYGPGVGAGCSISRNGRWLVCQVSHGSAGDKTEIWVQDLSNGGPMRPAVNDIAARFQGYVADDRMFILTNWKAPNLRVLVTDLATPEPAHWKEIIPERKMPIETLALAGGKIVIASLDNVVPRVEIREPDGRLVREIKPPAIGTLAGPFGRWDSDDAFYAFSTFGRPSTVYNYKMSTGEQTLWFQPKIPVDPASFEVSQVWFNSKDKTRVPMFVAHKKGLKLDGSNPALLTGYGGFTATMQPGFSAMSTVWMEMGGVWALASLRGGNEFGETWHRAGMLQNKQNVFDDFIGAAEALIEKGYTRKSRLAIEGGSNGGLLVGAAVTQRPDLFAAVICGAPLLDMVRYHKFSIARFWVPEYGSSEDPKQFEYIYRYSPYHHVVKGTKYPPVLFITGDADTRVDPLHARKMAALMQASTGSGKPILLHYDTKAGHSGGEPVEKRIENTADELAFLVKETGVK